MQLRFVAYVFGGATLGGFLRFFGEVLLVQGRNPEPSGIGDFMAWAVTLVIAVIIVPRLWRGFFKPQMAANLEALNSSRAEVGQPPHTSWLEVFGATSVTCIELPIFILGSIALAIAIPSASLGLLLGVLGLAGSAITRIVLSFLVAISPADETLDQSPKDVDLEPDQTPLSSYRRDGIE
jgi:hypothetical protein